MAYKLIWSPAALDDLHDIVVFIGRDNPNRAMATTQPIGGGQFKLLSAFSAKTSDFPLRLIAETLD